MPHHYRFTSRSLPPRRPGRLAEMASNHRLMTSLLISAALAACVTPGLMSLRMGVEVSEGPQRAGIAGATVLAPAELGTEREAAGGVPPGEVAPVSMATLDRMLTEEHSQVGAEAGVSAAPDPVPAASAAPQSAARPNDVEEQSRPPLSLTGTWAPNRAACDNQVAARTGWLPMKITYRAAQAGQTTCSFRRLSGDGSAWTAVAQCSGPRGHWVSNVRLEVQANSLRWSSQRGERRYVRCDKFQVAGR